MSARLDCRTLYSLNTLNGRFDVHQPYKASHLAMGAQDGQANR